MFQTETFSLTLLVLFSALFQGQVQV